MPSYKTLTLAAFFVAALAAAFLLIRNNSPPRTAPIIAKSDASRRLRSPLLPVQPIRSAADRSLSIDAKNSQNWNLEFRSSEDYFAFVSKAAKPALEGDGNAAYYVSKALQSCSLIVARYAHASDPQAAINSQLSAAPSWVADVQRRTFELCRRFLNADAFTNLPPRSGGYYNSAFWMDEAYKDNNPIAQSFHAASAIMKATARGADAVESSALSTAQRDINSAVLSGNPDALFEVGTTLSNGHGPDSLAGFALSIAACDLGYDCSAATNSEYFGFCVAAGNCPAGTTFNDIVTKAVGPGGYASAYARAQQIENALVQKDTSALQEFARLKETP